MDKKANQANEGQNKFEGLISKKIKLYRQNVRTKCTNKLHVNCQQNRKCMNKKDEPNEHHIKRRKKNVEN